MTLPSGRIVSFARNAVGELTAITMKKTAASPVENVATAIGWRPMSGLANGFTYGNGLTFAATYDNDFRLLTLKVKDGASDIISRTYAYGDGLNLTQIGDTVSPAFGVDMSYRPTNRLATSNGPWGNVAHSYDAVGNRTQEVKIGGGGGTTVWTYPATSNKASGETVNGAASRSFTQDAAGNLLTGLPQGASYALAYNRRNRPSQLKLAGAVVAEYGFNALEQLASRILLAPLTPAGTTHYIYDLDGKLIAEANGATGAITREYIWLEAMPVAVVDGTASPVTSFVHADHLMRPIRMTNAAKATVWAARWTAWGTPDATSGSATMNLRFPGQYFLIEQGLAYNWHRVYDPTTGRYTQPDPLGFPDGPARYAYARNSPLMNVDEEGLRRLVIVPPGPTVPPPPYSPPRSPSGIEGFFKNLWDMCFRTYDSAGQPVSDKAAGMAGTSGDCGQNQHRYLQSRVNEECKRPRACSKGMSDAELINRASMNQDCASARDRINKKCFKGGDLGHREAANDAWESMAYCQALLNP